MPRASRLLSIPLFLAAACGPAPIDGDAGEVGIGAPATRDGGSGADDGGHATNGPDGGPGGDAGTPVGDGGGRDADSGRPADEPLDAGSADDDAGGGAADGGALDGGWLDGGADGGAVDGGSAVDAGNAPTDAGNAPQDAGNAPQDAGSAPQDAGFFCGDGLCASDEWTLDCASDCGPLADVVDGAYEERVRVPDPGLDAVARAAFHGQNLIGLAVGVVDMDGSLYVKGFGYEDVAQGEPVLGERTRFRWASVSKTLTGSLAAQLAHEGALDLDASIVAYVPDYAVPSTYYVAGSGTFTVPADRRVVTARMLAAHTAGLPHYTNGAEDPQPPLSARMDPAVNTGFTWALTYVVNDPLVSIPGDVHSYSTFGFDLLGAVVQSAGGAPYEDLVAARIAGPAGLTTLQADVEFDDIPHRARGYDAFGADVGSTDVSWKLPGGGFLSTAADLARYCAALADSVVLDADEQAIAWTTATDGDGLPIGYGAGFALGTRDGRRFVEHFGSQEKASTSLRLYPDDGLCVVVMSNSEAADCAVIGRALEDVVRAR